MSGDPAVPSESPEPQSPEPQSPEAPAHDASGLDLARAIARSMARRTGSSPASGAAGTAGTSAGAAASGTRRQRPNRRTGAQVSGAYPDERDPQLVGATIDRLVDERGWSTEVAVHGVFGRWEAIVGPELAQHCRPERFAEGRLAVRADSTAWATQLRLLAPTLVRRLNEELGDGTVQRIEVLGPHLPSWSRGGRSLRDARGPRDTYG